MAPSSHLPMVSLTPQTIMDLPDHIIHLIFSFLGIEDIARFSILSRRCRELYLSVPDLNIHSNLKRRDLFPRKFLPLYMRDQRLLNRKEIRSLNLSWVFDEESGNLNEQFYLDKSLELAVACKVRSLNLDIQPDKKYSCYLLPPRIFQSEFLEEIALCMHNHYMLLPSFDCISPKVLLLKSVAADLYMGYLISSSFKSLRKLTLENVRGTKLFDISSPSLQELVIVSDKNDGLCHIDISGKNLETMSLTWFAPSADTLLKISAPNLKCLSMDGDIAHKCNLGNFSNLETAKIYMKNNPYSSSNSQASIDGNVVKLLQCISKAKFLSLSGSFLESLVANKLQPTMLCNVHSLHLQRSCSSDCQISTIAAFLQLLPCLKYLKISSYMDSTTAKAKNQLSELLSMEDPDCETDSWKSQSLEGIIQQLEEVEIAVDGGENELKLVEYLINHASALKNMIIYGSASKITRRIKVMKKAVEFQICFK